MNRRIPTGWTVFLVAALPHAARAAEPAGKAAAPPNAPCRAAFDPATGALTLDYHGRRILEAKVTARAGNAPGGAVQMQPTVQTGEKVSQVLVFTPAAAAEGVEVVLEGTVRASEEAFAAETLSEAQQRFPLVRNSVGLSRNLRNNAVYDRRWDWVLIGPGDGATRIEPRAGGTGGVSFAFRSLGRGGRLELTFRPRYYQKHLGFSRFEPWTYRVWKGSVTGYCTWWSYRGGFTQKTLDEMLAVFVEKRLPDFGYHYMQFDNCYQQGNGSAPHNWLNWNRRKYPGGWKYAIEAIRRAGMKPGIWVHRVHRPSDPGVRQIIEAHPDWFVPGADGRPHMQNGFCSLNMLNAEAVENMVRALYRGLKAQGWDYVKIDGTGDLLRAYQNKACAAFFEKHSATPEQFLRQWDVVAREELGPDVYILACHTVWNARHVMGLVDGARLSNDGFQPRTLAQYNHLEGVTWRNDPDHCDVTGGWLMDRDAEMRVFGLDRPVPARTILRPAICALAGGVLMVSDKAEVYRDDRNIEGMKRSAPVLSTVPGQLYGCGRRPMTWWLQEIHRPFDSWAVLGRLQWGPERREGKGRSWELQGRPPQKVAFADLGLRADREYLVFEFWTQKFLGAFREAFTAPAMDADTVMQVFAIRPARPHPWVLSTTRHISQGGVSLRGERWDADRRTLSGRSDVVRGDPYVLTVHVPQPYRPVGAEVGGEKARLARQGRIAEVRITPSATRTVDWSITFAR